LRGKKYEKELRKLQIEVCRLQEWVVHMGLCVIVEFEGCDAAGKGGTIFVSLEGSAPRRN
jgi:polyphosphate kinase 2 (PPK2 family)